MGEIIQDNEEAPKLGVLAVRHLVLMYKIMLNFYTIPIRPKLLYILYNMDYVSTNGQVILKPLI